MFRFTRPGIACKAEDRTAVGPHARTNEARSTSGNAVRRSLSRLVPVMSIVIAFSLAAGPTIDARGTDDAAAAGPPALVGEPLPPPAVSDSVPLLSAEHEEMVEWAKGLFEAAGLPLPEVVVSFHNNTEACHGFKGRWERADGIADRVMVCNMHDNPQLQEERQRRTLVHEFAHAWAASALDEDSRTRFMELRGLSSWSDASQPWVERGTEQAAVVVTWGVIDMDLFLWGFPNRTCPAMTSAYYLLTGTEPHTGLEENCG